MSSSVAQWSACLPLDLQFASSNPAEGDGLLIAIEIRSTSSFGGEVKPAVTCRNILQHVKELYEYERDIYRYSLTFLAQFLPTSILGVSAGYCQRAQVCESGMIRTQMGNHNTPVTVGVYGISWAITPHNSNST
jgi:hypothetical protein